MSKKLPGGTGLAKYLVLALIPAILLVSACKKTSSLGTDVLPASDILSGNFTDTTTLITSVKLVDSMPSNLASYNLIGAYNDPVFGMTKGTFYTQFTLATNSAFSFTPTEVIDSVVLVLPFVNGTTAFYGTLNPQTFIVDTIESSLVSGKTYYTDTNIAHGTTHIGSATIAPNLQTTKYDTVQYGVNNKFSFTPNLWIKLNKSFGQYVMNKYLSEGSANLLNYIKGICVSTSNATLLPGQGGIMYIDPYISSAGIFFYCRDIAASPNDTIVEWLPIGSGCASFSHFDHDYSTTAFYQAGKDSVVAPKLTYVQAMSGVKTQISFPYLSSWRNKGAILVSKAELDIPVDLSATGVDVVPESMSLVRDSAGHEFELVDEFMGPSYFGGTYNATDKQYVFNITRYVQSVLDGKLIDHGLYLIAGNSILTANGVILFGGKANSPRMRLKIFSTPLPH